MKRTQKIAAGGLMTAFACAVMLCSSLFPSGMYSFPAVSGIIILVLSYISGKGHAFSSYIAVSLLSLFLCPNKETVLCFICFFGYYPMLRYYIEKIKNRFIEYLIKLAVFNAAAVGVYFLILFLFSVPENEFAVFGVNIPLLFLFIFNIVFIIYDISIRMFERIYKDRIYGYAKSIFKRF